MRFFSFGTALAAISSVNIIISASDLPLPPLPPWYPLQPWAISAVGTYNPHASPYGTNASGLFLTITNAQQIAAVPAPHASGGGYVVFKASTAHCELHWKADDLTPYGHSTNSCVSDAQADDYSNARWGITLNELHTDLSAPGDYYFSVSFSLSYNATIYATQGYKLMTAGTSFRASTNLEGQCGADGLLDSRWVMVQRAEVAEDLFSYRFHLSNRKPHPRPYCAKPNTVPPNNEKIAQTMAPSSIAGARPPQPSPAQLDAVRASIRSLLHQPNYDDGSAGPVLVRLAWHSAGTYDAASGTGGSNGAGMRYEAEGGDPANAGLQHARAFLEPVKAAHPWITYADLWTLAGTVAIEAMGGPRIPWAGGRTDFGESEAEQARIPPRGRLPDGAQGAAHLRVVFGRMGFDDREIVALSGAHNLGRCHADRSGFDGKWVHNPTRFSNQYFRLLLANEKEWKRTTLDNGVEQFVYEEEQEEGADQSDGEVEKEERLMMLPTDMSLLSDPVFRQWVEIYAADKDRFFADFAAVFAKLLELGIRRDAEGNVINEANVQTGYRSAPKKSDKPQAKL
ncbi:heme peroxidase [Nemania abortiva]|nr:heme peroxidase [Nemania abortiva]